MEFSQDSNIAQLFRMGKPVIFYGSGINTLAPSHILCWKSLRDITLKSLAYRAGTEVDDIEELFEKPFCYDLSPEVIASYIAENAFGYFEAFRDVQRGSPNINHFYIAQMAKDRHISHIMTTNIDHFLEDALEEVEVSYKVYCANEEFKSFDFDDEDHFHLFKLHGCISDPQTILEFAAENYSLHYSKIKVLDFLLSSYRFLFLGYSGIDFQKDPDYLKMEQRKFKEIVWTALKEEHIPPQIRNFAAHSGDKTSIVLGALPQLFYESIAPKDHIKHENKEINNVCCDTFLEEMLNKWVLNSLRPEQCLYILGQLFQYTGNSKKALRYYEASKNIALQREQHQFVSKIFDAIGDVYGKQKDHEQAIRIRHQAKKIARKYSYTKNLGVYYRKIGNEYFYKDDKEQALKYYELSLRIAKKLYDQKSLLKLFIAYAQFYITQREYQKAKEYFIKARELAIEFDNKTLEMFLWLHEACCSVKLQNVQKGLQACLNIEKNASLFCNQRFVAYLQKIIGDIYQNIKDYDYAMEYYKKALCYYKMYDNRRAMSIILKCIGNLHSTNSSHEALEYYDKSVEILRDLAYSETVGFLENGKEFFQDVLTSEMF